MKNSEDGGEAKPGAVDLDLGLCTSASPCDHGNCLRYICTVYLSRPLRLDSQGGLHEDKGCA